MPGADSEFLTLVSEAQAANARGQTKRAVSQLWRAANIAVFQNNAERLETVLSLANAAAGDRSASVRKDALRLTTYCEGCLSDIRSGKMKKKRSIADLFTFNREPR